MLSSVELEGDDDVPVLQSSFCACEGRAIALYSEYDRPILLNAEPGAIASPRPEWVENNDRAAQGIGCWRLWWGDRVSDCSSKRASGVEVDSLLRKELSFDREK